VAKITTFQLPTKKNTSNSNIIAPINLKICKKSTVLHSQIVKNHTFLTSIRQLLLAHEDIDGRSREVPLLANLVLKITTIGLLDPLRQVAEEGERGDIRGRYHNLRILFVGCCRGGLELGHILNLDKFALVVGWWISTDHLLHIFVEFGSLDYTTTILIDMSSGFDHLVYALLGDSRSEDDREVNERSKTRTNGLLHTTNRFLRLVGHDVPLVDTDHQSLAVLLDELEDIHVLCLDATGSINHKDADIRILDGADGTQYGIVFDIFADLVLLANTGCIDQIEIEPNLSYLV